MEKNFWHEKWHLGEIAFHEGQPNRFLSRHFETLGLHPGGRVFLPLCGKTRDIAWLVASGFKVVGVELSEKAIKQLFDELEIEPEVLDIDNHRHYRADAIDIFVGDIFQINADLLGNIDAIYDRAALVALPEEMRRQYTRHLNVISSQTPQLLITFQYDQAQLPGPPFSIDANMLQQYYGEVYDITLIDKESVAGGLKGKVDALEIAWKLEGKH